MESETDYKDQCVGQLERILGSDMVWRSKRVWSFLNFVGWETLKGRGAQLTQTVIGEEAFDKSMDELAVRRLARDVRRKLGEYYEYGAVGYGDPILIMIPKGQYKVEFVRNPASLRIAS
jgi:hypothetical protein